MYRFVKRRNGGRIRIPVDEDGYVPFEALEERNAKRSARARTMDSKKVSKRVLSAPVTPEDAADWWVNPGRVDIEGIDAPARTRQSEPEPSEEPARKRAVRRRRKPNNQEYSESYFRKLPWKSDPYTAYREAGRALAAEAMLVDEDAVAYLRDVDYGEVDSRWDHDDLSRAKAYRDKVYSDYRSEELYRMELEDYFSQSASRRSRRSRR